MKSTAEAIKMHLTEFGPNAKVLLLAADGATLRTYTLEGNEGLLARFGDEFSHVDKYVQLTHHLGGVVTVTTMQRAANSNQLRGNGYFSMAVLEGIEQIRGRIEETTRLYVKEALQLGPKLLIESTRGEYNAE